MLAKRIIPCLDVRAGQVVKGVKFADIQNVADPVALAAQYSESGADELVFYDITASSEARDIFADVVARTAGAISIPLTVGGGVRSLDDFKRLMYAGADKVSINSAAVKTPDLIAAASAKYGAQCVVLSVDIKKINTADYRVYINGGRLDTGLDALDWVKRAVALGAGEVVVNVIDADGVKNGYDLAITRRIAEAVSVPIVASGGAGRAADFLAVLTVGKADAALAASVFHFGEIAIPTLKHYLAANNIIVRTVS